MLRLLGCGAVVVMGVLPIGGCRSAAEGSPAADVASVAADVARRTGAPPTAAPDTDTAAACGPLLARPLTEESAVKIALLRNATVRASYERLGIARAELLQAGLVSNPVFAISRKGFAHGPEIELALTQSFVDLFFAPLRRRIAANDLCATQAEIARELVHLVYDVRRAFVEVRGAQETVRVRQEARASVTTARDLMRRLHAAGNVRDPDLTIEEVGAARAQLGVDASELEARDARERLNVLLGLRRPDVGWTIEGALPSLPAAATEEDAEARALASSLELLEAKARLASALEGSGLARREGLFPVLDLGLVGKRESSDGAWGFGPALTTTIPIFDHGQARVLASNATARALVARHEQLTVEVGAAARRLADRARALAARERYLRETYLPLRTRYVDETMQMFNAMQIGAFDVLDAKEGETDARREHVETLVAAWRSRLDLAELLAGSLDRERLDDLHLPEAAEQPTPAKGH